MNKKQKFLRFLVLIVAVSVLVGRIGFKSSLPLPREMLGVFVFLLFIMVGGVLVYVFKDNGD